MANSQCKECGCICTKCSNDEDVHLHQEIEHLKQRLVEKDNHIVTMETNFLNEANKYPNGELLALHEELLIWQDKYKRLYDAHRRVQRVNQGLEDKLLRLVDISETDKSTLTKDIATLSHKLAEANYTIKKLTEDNERYKNDVSLAIQFLQCKPGNFVSQKFDTLPNEVQAKVSHYMGNKRKPEEKKTPPEIKSIKVPIPTFPPTAMVYSVPKAQSAQTREEREPESPVDIVSAAIMAKVLQERERERSCIKHCDTCTCSNQIKIIHDITHHSIATQTQQQHHNGASSDDALCLQCNHKLDRSTITIVKGVSSVEQCKNKTMPVYIHDYNEPVNPNVANIAKVQPNNFLNDNISNNDCSKLRKENVNSLNKLGSVRIRPLMAAHAQVAVAIDTLQVNQPFEQTADHDDDLIDLGTPSSTTSNKGNETIYFANEKVHKIKKPYKVKTHHDHVKANSNLSHFHLGNLITSQPHTQAHAHHKLCQQSKDTQLFQPVNRNILLDSSRSRGELQQVLVPVVPQIGKPSSLSSGDHSSEMTFSEPTTTNSTNNQRVEEWMESSNMTATTTAIVDSNYGTDCSESLVSLHERKEPTELNVNVKGNILTKGTGTVKADAIEVGIDTTHYKEIEDHVKKFLFGEYTILSEVKKNEYD